MSTYCKSSLSLDLVSAMDPLTALGFASNIIQLITFTSDLVSKGREIYKSADGQLLESQELDTVAKSLQDLCTNLPAQLRKKSLSKTESQLRSLCEDCNKAAAQLIDAIRGLKVTGSNKKWASFRQALNSVWKEDEIDALSKRLERYRSQLDTTLLISLREEINASNYYSHSTTSGPPAKPWHVELMGTLRYNDWQSKNRQDIAAFSSKLSEYTKEEKDQLIKQHIMEQLRFTNMGDRYERIEDAYQRTFNWIFEDGESAVNSPERDPEIAGLTEDGWVSVMSRKQLPSVQNRDEVRGATNQIMTGAVTHGAVSDRGWSNFISWLKGEEGVYWITGKPGSGKSTLMKYLNNDPRTMFYLRDWRGVFPLTTAGFFFWNSGTVMQMSKKGLLQAILYECIDGSLDLVPSLFTDRWNSYFHFGGDLRPWTWSELALAFKKLLADDSKRFFFLIDGLDEFDGDCRELVDFVLEYSARGNVKMCVASRPWLVFEDAFHKRPSLQLEDLTAPDIHLYASEKLNGSSMFMNLARIEPQRAKHLIDEVTGKASGVFLWVRLVVLSLLEGLRDGDRISDLQDRLYLLSSDLEELFSKILNRLEPSYFEQASKLFQFVRASDRSLSLLNLSFADEGFDIAMSAKVEPIQLDQAEYKAELMRRRLNSRCKGLLEAPIWKGQPIVDAEVQYLHRTVKDYLNRPDIWEYIISGGPLDFDPDLSLLGVSLMRIKTLAMSTDIMPRFSDYLTWYITFSLKFCDSKPEFHIQSLTNLDKIATELFNGSHPSGNTWLESLARTTTLPNDIHSSHWTKLLTGQNKIGLRNDLVTSFFEFAFAYPLRCYVDYELKAGRDPNSLIAGLPLLSAAVIWKDVALISMLINHGANPNSSSVAAFGNPWKHVLSVIANRGDSDNFKPKSEASLNLMADMIEIFLRGNADCGIKVDGQSVEMIIDMAFTGWDRDRTEELLRQVSISRKTYRDSTATLYQMKRFFRKFRVSGSKGP